jgi:hypothetical protein
MLQNFKPYRDFLPKSKVEQILARAAGYLYCLIENYLQLRMRPNVHNKSGLRSFFITYHYAV